jgi:hypothetical protein
MSRTGGWTQLEDADNCTNVHHCAYCRDGSLTAPLIQRVASGVELYQQVRAALLGLSSMALCLPCSCLALQHRHTGIKMQQSWHQHHSTDELLVMQLTHDHLGCLATGASAVVTSSQALLMSVMQSAAEHIIFSGAHPGGGIRGDTEAHAMTVFAQSLMDSKPPSGRYIVMMY